MVSNTALVTTFVHFKSLSKGSFTDSCRHFVESTCLLPTTEANIRSWQDCYDFLQENLPSDSKFDHFHLLFEFVMPESLCRADVVILTSKDVIVLEFKQKLEITKSDITQAAGYARSILHYHWETEQNGMEVKPYLVYTLSEPTGRHDIVEILSRYNFTRVIQEQLNKVQPISDAECQKWVSSPFYPLKNIAEATLQLFRDGTLPNIKTIREGDIQETLNSINAVIDDPTKKKNIIFVSGVPGAGKTLVGLKTVYDHGTSTSPTSPIYLSGNDPLVNILQNTLSVSRIDREGTSYIQPMKKFKTHAYTNHIPPNTIIVFDEAQRAWDTDRKEPGETEASLLLRIGNRIGKHYGKVTIICLIGDGQAIHLHEETGLPIWVQALVKNNSWNVFCPPNYAALFANIPRLYADSNLMLNTSIRNDFIDVGPWVEAILGLEFKKARRLYKEMLKKGFQCWIFRNQSVLPKAIKYVKENFPNSHTGLIVSSHVKNSGDWFGPQYQGSYVPSSEAYLWYSQESECLTRAASEFLIQGIELEYPIVSFLGDYYIENGRWVINRTASNPGLQNLGKVIQNVYRVLLTRSRKGMFLYFPRIKKLDETYFWFSKMLRIDED